MRIHEDYRFTAFAAPKEIVELTIFDISSEYTDPLLADGPLDPVEDEYGDLWLSPEIDRRKEYVPW